MYTCVDCLSLCSFCFSSFENETPRETERVLSLSHSLSLSLIFICVYVCIHIHMYIYMCVCVRACVQPAFRRNCGLVLGLFDNDFLCIFVFPINTTLGALG